MTSLCMMGKSVQGTLLDYLQSKWWQYEPTDNLHRHPDGAYNDTSQRKVCSTVHAGPPVYS